MKSCASYGIYAGEPTMKSDAGKTHSIWTATADIPVGTPLTEETRTNVCIVGAGIAGMTTAYLLSQDGLAVTVVNDGVIAGGETGRQPPISASRWMIASGSWSGFMANVARA